MANGPPAPAGLILAACCSAVFPDHGDLSQSLVGIGSSMPMASGWLMWTASREHQRHLGQAAITAGNCRPERHLYLNPEILRLPKRMPVLEIARHLVCSKCGARNSETHNPIWARPDARVGGVGHYPDYGKG